MEYAARLDAALASSRIPAHMWEGLREYILTGRPTGHFLTAVLSNDLSAAVGHGDDQNQRALVEYVTFLYHDAPAGCWGSPENVNAWMVSGGIEGLTLAAQAKAAETDPRRV